jgi:hypothetical protein
LCEFSLSRSGDSLIFQAFCLWIFHEQSKIPHKIPLNQILWIRKSFSHLSFQMCSNFPFKIIKLSEIFITVHFIFFRICRTSITFKFNNKKKMLSNIEAKIKIKTFRSLKSNKKYLNYFLKVKKKTQPIIGPL